MHLMCSMAAAPKCPIIAKEMTLSTSTEVACQGPKTSTLVVVVEIFTLITVPYLMNHLQALNYQEGT